MSDPLIIPPRFRGPPGSGNGGYVCCRIAAYLDGSVAVTLRRPSPLATAMTVELDGSVRVRHGDTLIAEAALAPDPAPAPAIPGPVSLEEAHAAAGRARYFADPVFPGCFGAGRTAGPATGCGSSPGRWLT